MLEELLKEAANNISDLDLDKNNYSEYIGEKVKSNSKTNKVYLKSLNSIDKIKNITFSPNAENSTLFIGSNLKGNPSFNIQQSDSLVFIGDNCNLREVDLRTQAYKACILVGSGVTTTGNNSWLTGSFPGSGFSSIIIGDDCLFSNDITIRGSDGHPVMTFDFTKQINSPHQFIVIEPYVWVGQGVRILKSCRVGTSSILGTSAVITKDIPQFCKAYGVPAKYSKLDGIWIKDRREISITTARKYLQRYKKHQCD